jgi:hypothetical protein
MFKRNFLCGLLLLGTALIPGLRQAKASAVVLDLFPGSNITVTPAPVTVDIRISGLGNLSSPSLGAFDLNLLFDPGILTFNQVMFGDPIAGDQVDMSGCGALCQFAFLTGPGALEIIEVSLDSPTVLNATQLSSFTLARVLFNSNVSSGSANTTLTLQPNQLANEIGDPISVGAAAIPEPSSILLVLGSLAGLVFYRRSVN